MILKNSEIVGFAQRFDKAFHSESQYFPAKINFYIHKNIKNLVDLCDIIDNARQDIFKRYGEKHEDGSLTFSETNRILANQEISVLLNLEQDVPISTIKLSDLDNLVFTPEQMQTLLFMIEED